MINEYSNGHDLDGKRILSEGSDASQEMPHEIQGDVRLRVEATDSVLAVISFVNTLRQEHRVRILEQVGTSASGVDIRLVLRRPIDFVVTLRQLAGVSKVEVLQSCYRTCFLKVHPSTQASQPPSTSACRST